MKPTLLILISIALASCAKKSNDLTNNYLKGNIRQVTETSYGVNEKFGDIQKGKLQITRITKYNEDGNLTEYRILTMPDSTRAKEDFLITIQFKDGKKISRTNGKTHKVIERYSYDNDKISEANIYGDDGNLLEKTKFKYNEDGLPSEENVYVSNGSLKRRVINKYTDSKQIKEQDIFTADNKVESVMWLNYNSEGQPTGYTLKSGTYTNNHSYKFSNLEHDNWLKIIEFDNGKPETLTERKIEYYN